jgi:hypothetical protein
MSKEFHTVEIIHKRIVANEFKKYYDLECMA